MCGRGGEIGTRNVMSEQRGRAGMRMLVAMAHPDDESFGMAGTIAKYASEGVNISLICATNGDVGTADPEYMEGYSSVAEMRLEELRCAAETLGFSELFTFGYRDSGMPGSPDNDHPASLHAADLGEVTRRIVEVIRRVRPHVVVTFDPYGGYGHPDHVKMHQATTRAFYTAADPGAYPEQIAGGLATYQPQKLYYTTFDRRGLKLLVRLMPLLGMDPEHLGRNGDINFRTVAEHTFPIHAYITTRRYAKQAEEARLCHASQLGGFGRPGLVQRFRRLFTGPYTETYMRAYPPVDGQRVRETDLFEGVVPD